MIERGTELFEIWADAFKLFSAFSDVPAEDDNEYWTKLMKTARELGEVKYGKSPNKIVFLKLATGVLNALEAQYKLKYGG